MQRGGSASREGDLAALSFSRAGRDRHTGEEGTDRAPIARAFRDKHGLTYPIWIDAEDKTMELYGGDGFPTNAVVDRDGNLRYAQSGYDEEGITRVIEQLLQR